MSKKIPKVKLTREEIFKKRLVVILNDQETISHNSRPCPRCGEDAMHHDDNALSRYQDVYICSDCGIDEAVNGELELEEWHFARYIDE